MAHICEASITVADFVTADDVSVTHLQTFKNTVVNAINSADGGLLQSTTVTTAKLNDNANPEKRWDESFTDFVYTGLLPPTSASLSSTTTAGTAYIEGVRVVKDATAKTYTASKHTYVDLSKTGTYTYSEVAINASEPAVTANSIRLARVSTDTTTVLSVRDDRSTTMTTLGATGMIFEGATDDAYETTISVTDPTADRTITLPNASGTITFNPVNTAKAYLSASQNNIANLTVTKVLLDTENFDVNNEFASNKFTAKTAGYYLILGSVGWNSNNYTVDKTYGATIQISGSSVATTYIHASETTNLLVPAVSTIAYLAINDYVELYCYHNAGADTPDLQTGESYTFLAIQRLTD